MNDQLDPVTLAVALVSLALGPALAKIVGPYAVIIIGACIGASWALSRRESTTRLSAAWFFARINLMALLLTVGIAELAHNLGAPLEVKWLLGPVAILVGGIGDDWPAVGGWIVSRIGRFIDLLIELRGGQRRASTPTGDDE